MLARLSVNEPHSMAGALVLGIAYGVDIKSDEDQRVIDARALMHMLAGSTIQGSYLVNNIPALKYVPDWMPGSQPHLLVNFAC